MRRRQTIGQLIRFGVSSGFSALASLGLPVLLHEALRLEQTSAVAISQMSVFLLNFLVVRMFVFQSTRSGRRDLGMYAASAACFRTAEYCAFLFLFKIVGIYYIAALVLTLAASTLIKFFWYRFLFAGQDSTSAVH